MSFARFCDNLMNGRAFSKSRLLAAVTAIALFCSAAGHSEAPKTAAKPSEKAAVSPATAPAHTLASSLMPPAHAPSAAADPVPSGPFENELIPRRQSRASTDSGGASDAKADGATQPASAQNPFQTARLCLALGSVLAIIFVLQKFGRRFFGGAGATGSHRGIRVVSRSPISPRQHLLLIQVGRKLVLVGNSGAQMNPLCEIADPDEVALLLGQARGGLLGKSRDAQGEAPEGAFRSIFRRAGKSYESLPPGELDSGARDRDDALDDPDTAPSAETDSALDAAMDAADQSSFESPEDAPASASDRYASNPAGAAVAATRDELSGLMDKVRRLSRHFQRT